MWAIEQVFGKTRLEQRAKLEQFGALLAEHFGSERAGSNDICS